MKPEWEDNPHQSTRVATPKEAANQLPPLSLHHNYLSVLDHYKSEWEDRENKAVDTFVLFHCTNFVSDFLKPIGIYLRIIPP